MPDTFTIDDDLVMLEDTLSPEIVDILTKAGETPKDVLGKPVTVAPPLDTSHPISHYLISTSHNTYLTAHQLYGSSSTSAYSYVISRNGRCVEIDAWDGPDGTSVVYHGYTLTSKIPIKDVCEAINAELKSDDLPLIVALECHADVQQQEHMVQVFEEVFGDRLVKGKIEGDKDGKITLEEARGKILIKVEHCAVSDAQLAAEAVDHPDRLHSGKKLSWEADDGDESDEDTGKDKLDQGHKQKDEDEPHVLRGVGEDNDEEFKEAQERKKNAPPAKIWIGLARLGVYTTSIKPKAGGGFLSPTEDTVPANQVINISESGLQSLFPDKQDALVKHNANYLMRVYPKGTRISSDNLNPIPCWSSGAQLVALNWQKTDKGLQCNEALFAGTGGWVLKPPSLIGGPPLEGRQRLIITLVAGNNLERPDDCKGSERLKPYAKVQVLHAEQDIKKQSKTIVPDKKEGGGGGENPVFSETFEFEFSKAGGITFLRILLYHYDGRFSADDFIAATCLRVEYLQNGYRFIRLKNQKGQDTTSLLLVKIKVEDV